AMSETRFGSPSCSTSRRTARVHRPAPAPTLTGATKRRAAGTPSAPHPTTPPTAAIVFRAPRRPVFESSGMRRAYRAAAAGRKVAPGQQRCFARKGVPCASPSAHSRRNERLFVQGVEARVLSGGLAGARLFALLRRAASHSGDQQHVLPDAHGKAR